MYLKLHCFIRFLVALALGLASVAAAHAQAPARTAAAAPASVRGHIADPTGALIPGAKITVTTTAGAAVTTTTADSTGAYAVNGLAPGGYVITAVFAGFAPASSPAIQVAAGQVKHVDISMAMVVAQQSVTVSDEEAPMVSVEASGNTSSVVLKDKDLDALSDDPDELSNELTALAGPAAGPNGGEVYISGFTGGQLAPQVGDSRDSHQPESLLGRVRPPGLRAHRDSDQARNRPTAWAILCPGQRRRLQHRQPVHYCHSRVPQHPVQRLNQRFDLKIRVVFYQRGCSATTRTRASTQ